MGSYDEQPADWDDYADTSWNPPHAIVCRSTWNGQEPHSHRTADEVRICYAAMYDEARGIQVWPCGWLMEGRYDDGSKFTYPCPLPARFTDDRGSYECAGGHDYVPPQVRMEQGWDYAADDEEARMLRQHGVDVVSMCGDSI